MRMIWITISGMALAAVGAVLLRRFGARAKREGIGTFTLLPLSGIAYLIGILCIIVGSLFILLGLSAGS
jgi:hypothetical protein